MNCTDQKANTIAPGRPGVLGVEDFISPSFLPLARETYLKRDFHPVFGLNAADFSALE